MNREEYEELRNKVYTRAIDALLAYQRLSNHICYDEEFIEIEVNGLKITIQHVNI